MHKNLRVFVGLAALAAASSTMAAGADVGAVADNFRTAATAVNKLLVPKAMQTACAALMLQWVLSHWKEFYNGDITSSLAKSVGLICWFGAAFLLLKNQDQFLTAFSGYIGLAKDIAGIPEFSPMGVLAQLQQVLSVTTKALFGTASSYSIGDNLLAGIVYLVSVIIFIVCYGVIALSLFIAVCEFYMLFAVAPLAAGLLPLSAFREQGMAPLKGVMAMGLRIIILALIVSVTQQLTVAMVSGLGNGGTSGNGQSMLAVMVPYFGGIGACAVMAFSAGTLAANIASGSASFSGSDAMRGGMAVAQTAATSAAAAGALAAGGAALAGASRSALGDMAGKFGDAFKLPAGTPQAAPAAGNGGKGVLGGPIGGPPPSETPAKAAAAAADTAPAGIGGTSQPQQGPSASQKLMDSASRAAEAHSQPQQATSVSMNLHAD